MISGARKSAMPQIVKVRSLDISFANRKSTSCQSKNKLLALHQWMGSPQCRLHPWQQLAKAKERLCIQAARWWRMATQEFKLQLCMHRKGEDLARECTNLESTFTVNHENIRWDAAVCHSILTQFNVMISLAPFFSFCANHMQINLTHTGLLTNKPAVKAKF